MTDEQKLIVEITTRLLEATCVAERRPARYLYPNDDVKGCVKIARQIIEASKSEVQ